MDAGTGLEGLEKNDKKGDRGELGRMMVRVSFQYISRLSVVFDE